MLSQSCRLWTVQKAVHKTNGKAVSIWTFDKNALAGASKVRGKLESAIEVLKKEVLLVYSRYAIEVST